MLLIFNPAGNRLKDSQNMKNKIFFRSFFKFVKVIEQDFNKTRSLTDEP